MSASSASSAPPPNSGVHHRAYAPTTSSCSSSLPTPLTIKQSLAIATGSMRPQQQLHALQLQRRLQSVNAQKNNNKEVMSAKRLQDLVATIDPSETLDTDVEDLLLQIADDFIEDVASFSCLLAKHRMSTQLEVKDVQLYLEHNWNIRVPGFTNDAMRKPYRNTLMNAKNRLNNYKAVASSSTAHTNSATSSRKRKAEAM